MVIPAHEFVYVLGDTHTAHDASHYPMFRGAHPRLPGLLAYSCISASGPALFHPSLLKVLVFLR